MALDPGVRLAADAALARYDTHLRDLRRRYPTALIALRQFAERRGDPALADWPDWCWVPMAGSVAVVTSAQGPPADIARVAALAAWRLGRGVYVLDEDVTVDAVATVHQRQTIPADQILNGLPEFCCYVVLPEVPVRHPSGAAAPPKGLYVHLESDANTRRPELRLLLDRDGSWEGLLSVIIYLDRATLTTSAADVLAQARASLAGVAGTDLRAIPTGYDVDPAQGLMWALSYLAWPAILALTDPTVHIVGLERPGERPQRAQPVAAAAGGRRWRAAPDPGRWRVTKDVPRPQLRQV
jgi:hypothetical protein